MRAARVVRAYCSKRTGVALELIQILLLGLVQGLTEFLPISSSAHLILFGRFAGFGDQGLVFDVAAHLGSLLAVIVYFRRDLLAMVSDGAIRDLEMSGKPRQLLLWLPLATLPLIVVGLLASDVIGQQLRSAQVIAWATIGFGLLLWLADTLARRNTASQPLTANRALAIGLGQALALIPGTSRAGITMTVGLMLGLSYQSAARFSFLLAIPAIGAAGAYGLWEMLQAGHTLAWIDFGLAVVASAIGAGLCIHWFLKLLDTVGLLPFVLYRLALGIILLTLVY